MTTDVSTREVVSDLRRQVEDASLQTADEIERFRVDFLGRKSGRITNLFKTVSTIPPDQRREFGQEVNALKQLAEARLEEAEALLAERTKVDQAQALDLTLPGRLAVEPGRLHPLTSTLDDIRRVFERCGFSVAEGPEIEDDWHNFTALNFPPDHPARDMQDTFFLEPPDSDRGGVVLRTHTSPVQIRVMKQNPPPIRVIVPGRVYRNESISYKSFCLFHQVEGLYVDKHVTFADLKHVLKVFARAIFGDDVRMRFRPSYFPFTEPSAEVDIWWQRPGQDGRWMEILGCGMVDPNVLTAVDVDPSVYSGYAFGMGVERIAMIRHGIDDIRMFYENDVRFLDQFDS